ncbi:disease resistance protein RUN1-like [Macadamia integrifolia]|uniref:disease resistance protein RUN1-like n=1 Tax=Macadamia integrifolia TaxID=60698 RepID=UPI001C4FD294|nr:disease resistance protein RUN1-like [Macadamia integrifolia]
MHDQIQFMGRRIVSKESHKDPAKRSRLWSHHVILKVFEKGMGTQMAEGILLPFEVCNLSFEDFAKMPNLRFLKVSDRCDNLNGDFSHLPSQLRWFRWQCCPLKILSTNFYHEELVHLDLSSSNINLAWNDTPQNKNKLFQKLKVLILSYCWDLCVSSNLFSWFPCLKRLDLSCCNSLLELPYNICQMASLQILIFNNCESFNKLPMSIGALKHLVKFLICGTNIEELPDGVGQLEKLKELDVSHCCKLVRLPTSMGRMRSLLYLNLDYTMIAKLPNDFSKLISSLEVLKMGMEELDNQTDYKRLQPLLINMSGFPSQLQVLYLEGYMNLESIPKLPSSLTHLEVKKCNSLQIISDLSHLESLKELLLYDCRSLVRLSDLSNLKSLRKLSICNCENLEEIHGLEGTQSLQQLKAPGCHKLTETTRKILGQGRLIDNVGQSVQGSNSIAADDHHIYQALPILCVVFALTSGKMWEQPKFVAGELLTITLWVNAYIRWGVKRTFCRYSIRIEDIKFTKRDIIYIHHFKGFDWFGFPLGCNDAIEELSVDIDFIFRHSNSGYYCSDQMGAHVKLWKVLFENKDSEQQMPNQESSAMLVADFFRWSDAVDDEVGIINDGLKQQMPRVSGFFRWVNVVDDVLTSNDGSIRQTQDFPILRIQCSHPSMKKAMLRAGKRALHEKDLDEAGPSKLKRQY